MNTGGNMHTKNPSCLFESRVVDGFVVGTFVKVMFTAKAHAAGAPPAYPSLSVESIWPITAH